MLQLWYHVRTQTHQADRHRWNSLNLDALMLRTQSQKKSVKRRNKPLLSFTHRKILLKDIFPPVLYASVANHFNFVNIVGIFAVQVSSPMFRSFVVLRKRSNLNFVSHALPSSSKTSRNHFYTTRSPPPPFYQKSAYEFWCVSVKKRRIYPFKSRCCASVCCWWVVRALSFDRGPCPIKDHTNSKGIFQTLDDIYARLLLKYVETIDTVKHGKQCSKLEWKPCQKASEFRAGVFQLHPRTRVLMPDCSLGAILWTRRKHWFRKHHLKLRAGMPSRSNSAAPV